MQLHFAGLLDLSDYDPRDVKWELRRQFAATELLRRADYALQRTAHDHASRQMTATMTMPEMFSDRVQARQQSYARMLQLALPGWAASLKIDDRPMAERLRAKYVEKFGQPGEERYDRMIQVLDDWIARPPLTEEEKTFERQVRKRRRELRRAQEAATETKQKGV